MNAIFALLAVLFDLAAFVLFVRVIMSWLIQFQVIPAYHPFVSSLLAGLHALTEPMLRPIRRIVPNAGGLDLSVIVAFLIIIFLDNLIQADIRPYFLGS